MPAPANAGLPPSVASFPGRARSENAETIATTRMKAGFVERRGPGIIRKVRNDGGPARACAPPGRRGRCETGVVKG